MADLSALAEILATGFDPVPFDASRQKNDLPESHWELRRRTARAQAWTGIRIAKAMGWRFIPPGEFEVLSEETLDASSARAQQNLRDAADQVERQ